GYEISLHFAPIEESFLTTGGTIQNVISFCAALYPLASFGKHPRTTVLANRALHSSETVRMFHSAPGRADFTTRQIISCASFDPFLTLNAVPRPWNCFESFGIDLFPARHTLTKRAFSNTLERSFHISQQAMFADTSLGQHVLRMTAPSPVESIRSSFVLSS